MITIFLTPKYRKNAMKKNINEKLLHNDLFSFCLLLLFHQQMNSCACMTKPSKNYKKGLKWIIHFFPQSKTKQYKQHAVFNAKQPHINGIIMCFYTFSDHIPVSVFCICPKLKLLIWNSLLNHNLIIIICSDYIVRWNVIWCLLLNVVVVCCVCVFFPSFYRQSE